MSVEAIVDLQDLPKLFPVCSVEILNEMAMDLQG
jgi:hypothetical protein